MTGIASKIVLSWGQYYLARKRLPAQRLNGGWWEVPVEKQEE